MFGGKQLFTYVGVGAAGAGFALANGTIYTFTILDRCIPIRCGVRMTINSSVGGSTVKFTGAGGTGGNCGTLTIPLTATAGKTYYEETDYPTTWIGSLSEGDQVTVIVSGSSDATGYGVPYLKVIIDPERPANNSNMIAG